MIGETIGNFRLIKRLGAGGMGEVFAAEHKELQTPVAVKLLGLDISRNHEHVQRFFNEARIVSKIKHAGTVKIFDSGFHGEQAYLIMELLEGASLAARIEKERALSAAQVVDIARQISSVLEATHRQGVIHRDLKPDNIFLVLDDERASGERVKILDFGIAKLSGTMSAASPKTSGTMGTPAYMAPEQWGDSANVDWRADAYSLGCVMFEMATGRPPFIAHTIAEAYTKHLKADPPTPSSLVEEFPPAVEQLILRLLAKEPSDRAVSMGQITRELAELAGEPLPTETPARRSQPINVLPPQATTLGGSAAELQRTKSRARPALLAAIAAAVAIMVVVSIVMITSKRDDGHRRASTTPSPPLPTQPAAPEMPPAEQPPPAPPPVQVAPPVPAPPVVTAAGSAAPVAVKPPKRKPVVKPKPAEAGSAKPATGDDEFGGRL